MAKKIRTVVTLQLPAGKATPAPPVGTVLGPHGINIVEFTKSYNEKTAAQSGQVIPAQITIFEDRSFTFILKTPPSADMLRKAAGLDKGSATTGRDRGRVQSPAPSCARSPRSRWPTSTPSTSTPPRASSRARPARWASRSPASHHIGRRRQRTGPTGAIGSAGTSTPRPRGRSTTDRTEEPHMPQHGKQYRELAQLVDRETGLRAGRGDGPAQGDLQGQLRPDRRGAHPPRRRPPPCGPDGPRHGRPAARRGQDHPGARVRPGRQGPGGPQGRRRRGRRRGSGQAHRGRLAGVRRRARDARHDGHGRQARPHPRPPRPDAEPQVGHHHLRHGPCGPRGEGRPRRVQGRQGRHHPRRLRHAPASSPSCSSRTWRRSSTP